MIFIIGPLYTKYLETQFAPFSLPQGISNSGIHMKKTLLAAGAVLAPLRLLLSTQLKTTNRSIFPTVAPER